MIEADRVLSTPPLNSSSIQDANCPPEARGEFKESFSHQPAIGQPGSGTPISKSRKPVERLSRRTMLASLAVLPAVVGIPPAVPMAVAAKPDPIFSALDAYRAANAEFYVDRPGDIPDEIGDRWSQAVDVVVSTQPTTPAGLGALTSFARDMVERAHSGDASFTVRQKLLVMAAIDDATRGMARLEPWSPPQRPKQADAELIELGCEFERLLAIEEPTEGKHERLSRESDRLHRIKLGCDPEDEEAYRAIQRDVGSGDKAKWIEWNDAWKAADEETGRNKAWHKWNVASLRTARVGRKILKIQPKTMAGFLVRVRVIETHDEILKIEPDRQLLKEIRSFAKRIA